MIRTVVVLAVLLTFAVPGCSPKPPMPADPVGGRTVDLSEYSYEQVANVVNARAERLERFWAATIVKVWYIGKEGENEVDQLDGDIHIVQPDMIAMSLEKVGIDVAALGANERFYWYLDLIADEEVASIGTHERANPDQLASLGVPVHPLDLLLLLGFSTLPDEPLDPDRPLRVSESGRHIVVSAPARWGIVDYLLDPDTFEPIRVEIRRADRLPAVLTADMLEGSIEFQDRVLDGSPKVRIPRRIVIDVPEIEARVQVRFLAPRVRRRKPDERAFDLGDTLSRYGVGLRRDLDVMHDRLRDSGS